MATEKTPRGRRDRVPAGLLRWLFGWILLPVLALYVLTLVPSALDGTIAAARGEGQPGTFVATRVSCGKSCAWYGEYISDDGTKRFDDILIDGGPYAVGDTVPALYVGGGDPPPTVYAADGSYDWAWITFTAVVASGYLMTCAVVLVRRLSARRA